MKVSVDIMELDEMMQNMVSKAEPSAAAKAYMDFRLTIFDYLCEEYKKQTGIVPNDVTGVFKCVNTGDSNSEVVQETVLLNNIQNKNKGFSNPVISSEAFRALNHAARSVYIDMIDIAGGDTEVIYTQKMAYDHFKMSKGGYTTSINQLVQQGLIERTPRSCYSPSKYLFSEKWKAYHTNDTTKEEIR